MQRTAGATPRFLTIPEAAFAAGVSPDTIRRRIKAGRLPASLFAGKWRVLESDLVEYVRSGELAA